MTSKPSESFHSTEEYKAILDEVATNKDTSSKTDHLPQPKGLPRKSKWFKGGRNRDLKGTLARYNNE